MSDQAREESLRLITGRLLKKSIDANRLFWWETANQFYGLASGKRPAGGWQRMGSANFWTSVTTDLARLYFRYAENVVDYGLEVLHHLEESKAEPSPAPPESAPGVVVLPMAGEAGQVATAGFKLNSSEGQEQTGVFLIAPFIAEGSTESSAINLAIEPGVFTIPSGGAMEFEVKADIPAGTSAGIYRSKVLVDGFSDARFEVLLEVKEKERKPKRTATRKKKTDKS